jgi:PTS system nitrogen regulatory IIA component
MTEDILTIEEVAKYLRVSDRTVYDWAQKGEIPAGKIGTVWRFKKSEIENWVNARLSSSAFKSNDSQILVKNILSPDRIVFINHSSKHDAIVQLSQVLATAPQIKNASELTTEILKREELMSTAIGKGIAIPHVRLSSVTDLVMAVGVCKKPIADYQTIDDEPVDLLFMIAAAYNQHSQYLKTLSHFCAKLKQEGLHSSIIAAKSEQEVFSLLA